MFINIQSTYIKNSFPTTTWLFLLLLINNYKRYTLGAKLLASLNIYLFHSVLFGIKWNFHNVGNTFLGIMCNYLSVLHKWKHASAVLQKWCRFWHPKLLASSINNNGTQRKFNCTWEGNYNFWISKGKTTLETCNIFGRYYGTLKKFVAAPDMFHTMAERGPLWTAYHWILSHVKWEDAANNCFTSDEIFRLASKNIVAKSTCCHIIKMVSWWLKPVKRPQQEIHQKNHFKLAKEYMTTNFAKVFFTDETRVTLYGPDGWSNGCVANRCVS